MNSATVERPPVPYEPEPGNRWAAKEAGPEWALADPGRTCRANRAGHAHGVPAVVKLLRGVHRRVWWHYCLEDAYDRWVEDGKVMQWVLEDDPDWKPPES